MAHVNVDLRNGWTLARTELRARFRQLRSNRRRLLAVVLGFGWLGLFLSVSFLPGAIAFGSEFGSEVPIGTAGMALSAVTITIAYLGAANGFARTQIGSVEPLARTSIPPRAVSIGRIVAQTVQSAWFVVPIGVVLLAGVAIGGGPIVAGLVLVAALPLIAVGLVVGRVIGGIARYLNERLQVSLWVKAVVLVGLMGVIFLGVQALLDSRYETGIQFATGPILPAAPLQSYAAVFFAPFGTTPGPLGVGVIGVVLVMIPVGMLGMLRLETYLLVTDVGSDGSTARQVEASDGTPHLFEVTPSTRIGWRYLVRTRRDPRMLAHLTPILFGVFGVAGSAIQDPGILLSIGPGAAVVVGAILAGSAYCLNPLGDDRDQLPLLFTSTDSIGVVLRGRMLAGAVLGLLVGIGLGVPLAAVEYGPGYILGQSLLAVVLTVASVGVAVGLGAIAPKFERREYMNVERAHPSQWALFGFALGEVLVAAIGFLLLGVTLSGEHPLPAVFGWLLYVLVLGLVSWGGYRYAVGRFDSFTMDDI
ncbi:MAG: hypothetical protein ACOCPX_08285 [Halapricum sp.]